jgi:hypothetical protein
MLCAPTRNRDKSFEACAEACAEQQSRGVCGAVGEGRGGLAVG